MAVLVLLVVVVVLCDSGGLVWLVRVVGGGGGVSGRSGTRGGEEQFLEGWLTEERVGGIASV